MVVKVLAGDTLTGRIWGEVPLAEASVTWTTEHRGDGEIQVTIPLTPAVLMEHPGIVQALQPWKCFLAVVTGTTVLEAGPIRPHAYSDKTGLLRIAANGLRTYFAKRFVMGDTGVAGKWQRVWFPYSGWSLGTIAKRVVQISMAHTGGNLPIDLPDDERGSASEEFFGYELLTVAEAIRDIEDQENGPDVRFEPYLLGDTKTGYLRWRMDTGKAASPELTQYNRPGGAAHDHVWDRTAPKTPVDGLDVDLDVDEMGDRVWITGQGSENEMRIGRADVSGLRSQGYPLLEHEGARGNVKNQVLLNSYASAEARRCSRPWVTWNLTVKATTDPALGPVFGTYRPGDWVRIYVGATHPYIKAREGYYRTRIMKIAGDLTDVVTITLAPQLEDR